MSATNTFESSILQLVFNNTNFANIGDATGLRGSSAAGVIYLSLHTADPGETGNQTTSEATYTGYNRVSVLRQSGVGGWTISGTAPTQAALTTATAFPTCNGGTNTITHFGVGTASSGAGVLLFKGAVSPNISVITGVIPQLTSNTVVTCD
jgi:hypothetical protein